MSYVQFERQARVIKVFERRLAVEVLAQLVLVVVIARADAVPLELLAQLHQLVRVPAPLRTRGILRVRLEDEVDLEALAELEELVEGVGSDRLHVERHVDDPEPVVAQHLLQLVPVHGEEAEGLHAVVAERLQAAKRVRRVLLPQVVHAPHLHADAEALHG